MPLTPMIPLAGRTPEMDLSPFFQGQQAGLRTQAGLLALDDARRQQAEEAAVRQAYAQHYGGAPTGGFSGPPQPAQPGLGGLGAVHERQLNGSPTPPVPNAQAAAPPAAPSGLAGLGGQMPQPAQQADAQGRDQQAFIRQLYTISPQAGREAEAHAVRTDAMRLAHHLEQVQYLEQVARGVLDADSQQAYELGIAQLQQAGVPTRHLPAVYDRQMVQMYHGMAMSSAQRLHAQLADLKQMEAAWARSTEQRRLDLTERGQNITLRGQDLEHEGRQLRLEEIRLDIAKKQREAGGQLSTTDQRKLTLDLRSNIRQEPSFKAFQDVRNGYDSVRTGAPRQDGAGDLAMINGLQKILDPGVSVRQEEFKTVAAAQGFLQRVLNMPGRILEGNILSPAARAKVLDMATTMARQKADVARKELTTVYGPLAQDAGIALDQLLPLGLEETGQQGATGTAQPAVPARKRVARQQVDALAQKHGVDAATMQQRLEALGYEVEP